MANKKYKYVEIATDCDVVLPLINSLIAHCSLPDSLD